MIANRYNLIGIMVFVMIIFSSCSSHEEDHYHKINEKIEAKSTLYKGTTSSEKFIEPETIHITEDEFTFMIPERKSHIISYACTECHTKPLEKIKDSTAYKKAHWNIKLKHAKAHTMNCFTCHNNYDMDNLKSLTNKSIDFNHSYKMCSQCHTQQFDDWKGGAHGKRIGGWAPPRASLTCVNCHNPHKPAIESRWPSRFNTRKKMERD